MTGSKGIIFLIIAAIAALALWFGLPSTEQTPETSALATETQQPTATPTEPTEPTESAEPDAEPAEPETPATETTEDDTATNDNPAQPQVDTSNWICTAWTDASGNVVTTGTASNETCTQWSVKRGAVSE